MSILRALLACTLAFWLAQGGAQDLAGVPPLKARVTDLAGMLDARQRATLEQVLQDYETRSGSQIALLLLGSTAPETLEQYGIRVADAWKLGRKGLDDGVILIVAKDNPKALRRLRIEAGRGVQGSLTDAQSKRIVQDVIAPHFRQNDFYGGLAAGISAIAGLLEGEHLAAPVRRAVAPADDWRQGGWLPLLLAALLGVGALAARAGRARNALNSNGWGRAAGVILGSGIGSGIGIGSSIGSGFGGGASGRGAADGGWGGGGGGFDGGGASGDW